MRALLVAAAIALLAGATTATSPWKIIESWTQQMPGGRAMDIAPVYSAIQGMYFTTSHDGTVQGVNLTTHSVSWTMKFPDITFLEAIPDVNGLVVGCSSGTTMLQASTGGIVWQNSSIQIMADLSNHGDRNFLIFDNVMVYRELALGFSRLCMLDIYKGERLWCDTFRIYGLPDYAPNNTFTAPLFDQNGRQYAAAFSVVTGQRTWIYPCDTVMTGNLNYVAVAKGTHLVILNSSTGAVISSRDIFVEFQGTSVMVHGYLLAITDGMTYVAAINMQFGETEWNVTIPTCNRCEMQLQHRGDGVLVLAILGKDNTNFTRFNAYQGNRMWTAAAKATGNSLAPVHGWLGNDILYCVTKTGWAAYGVDTGDVISQGSGDLFLPRSSAPDLSEPHVGYLVTGPEGIVYHLKIVPRS